MVDAGSAADHTASEDPANMPCPLCGKTHNRGAIDRLIGLLHRIAAMVMAVAGFLVNKGVGIGD